MNTIVVAGLFTVIGASIPLAYQVVDVHNQNRREDSRSAVNAAADLIAAAHQVLLTRAQSSDARRCRHRKNGAQEGALGEAFLPFESAYARLVLLLPRFKKRLEEFRENLDAIAKPDMKHESRGKEIEKIKEDLKKFPDEVREQLKLEFPALKWWHRLKKRLRLGPISGSTGHQ
jgi:hypothetical protein